MHPAREDLEALITANRDLLASKELDLEWLAAWRAERKLIFSRLKERGTVPATTDAFAMSALLRQLLDLDARICARLIESQTRLGAQIARARKIRHAVSQGISRAPRSLERLA